MPWFEGSHAEKRTVAAPLDAVRAHFADPNTILAHTKDVESGTVDDRTIHFVMKEEDHGIMKFQADFRCTYTLDGDVLSWETHEGNLKQTGTATFAADGAGTVVDYTEKVEVDLGVPAMAAPMLKPVIGAMLSSEIKGFFDRMAKSVS